MGSFGLADLPAAQCMSARAAALHVDCRDGTLDEPAACVEAQNPKRSTLKNPKAPFVSLLAAARPDHHCLGMSAHAQGIQRVISTLARSITPCASRWVLRGLTLPGNLAMTGAVQPYAGGRACSPRMLARSPITVQPHAEHGHVMPHGGDAWCRGGTASWGLSQPWRCWPSSTR